MTENKTPTQILSLNYQIEPSEANQVPSWSMFCVLNLRTACPHCGSLHSLFKVNNSTGIVQLCCKADYNKNLPAAREQIEGRRSGEGR